MSSLPLRDARRIALAAQGFGRRLPGVLDVFDHVALVQVDSVNVVVRSQELPLWSRLGPHPRDAIPKLCARGELFEYWAHEASLMRVELQPLLRWRMAEARDKAWRIVRTIAQRDPGYVKAVRDEVHARGQLVARDLEPRPTGRIADSMWRWDERKQALAYLFWAGEIAAIRSASTFERVYAPLERVLPRAVLEAKTPRKDDAQRELLRIAAKAHGIGTLRDLADYFRIRLPEAKPLVADAGLTKVTVEGSREAWYLHPQAPAPKPVRERALLSPFDSLVWERRRTKRLFGFDYRIEIYTPREKRRHGYYVLPFLLGEALVARVDLKADRESSALLVQAAWREDGADCAGPLVDELRELAAWLGLERVKFARRGNLKLSNG